MKNFPRPVQILVALALSITGCAPRAQSAERTDLFTATIETLPGGLIPNLGATPPAAAPLPPAAQPSAAQNTLPPIPTLVPTIALPTLPPLTPAAPEQAYEPGPTPIPAARLDPACLNGAWQVTGLQEVMAGSLAQSGSGLALERVDGQVGYVFAPDGSMSLTYRQLAAVLNGTVDALPVHVVQSLDGTATARYTVDAAAGMIELSGFGGEGIRSALEINGQTLAEGSLPVWLAFTRGQARPETQPESVPVSRAAAACDGNRLVLQALEPVPGPALVLERVGN